MSLISDRIIERLEVITGNTWSVEARIRAQAVIDELRALASKIDEKIDELCNNPDLEGSEWEGWIEAKELMKELTEGVA